MITLDVWILVGLVYVVLVDYAQPGRTIDFFQNRNFNSIRVPGVFHIKERCLLAFEEDLLHRQGCVSIKTGGYCPELVLYSIWSTRG